MMPFDAQAPSRPVVRHLDLPVSSRGKIIGKGGDTIRRLQEEFGVVLRVPRADAPAGSKVTLRGSPDACDACAKRMEELVQSMSRGKDSKIHPFPSSCAACGGCLRSFPEVWNHLISARHMKAIRDRLPHLPATCVDILAVVELLTEARVRELHVALGYDVDALLDQAPAEQERRAAAESLRNEAAKLPRSSEWLRVEERRVCRFNYPSDSDGKRSMLLAPALDEILVRCLLDDKPPVVLMPGLPAALPRMDPKYRQHNRAKLTFTARLGIAVVKQLGYPLDGFDLICSTAFIKALSGGNDVAKDTWYLQRFGKTLCALHVPAQWHTDDDAGHAVERLLCGSSGSSFYNATVARIGPYRVLIWSEVDASDELGRVVEVKSSSTKTGPDFISSRVALQVALNGSHQVLGCILDGDKAHMIRSLWISVADALESHQNALISRGQRVLLLLECVINDDYFDTSGPNDRSCVMKMCLDDIKVPVLIPAQPGVEVLPHGLW
uniref:K Homology domain-containing protein n=1 Tax=Noctiluca scintillans TaxID=2966 RepID=A0A7S1APF9_NOCSC|mmetsp:Transcript_54541/g.145594  ORF Transcript_54541/g.145594 Transcript_54541/m.145594 type:complete len:496 (+) Transcript_54541:51-1538(+)